MVMVCVYCMVRIRAFSALRILSRQAIGPPRLALITVELRDSEKGKEEEFQNFRLEPRLGGRAKTRLHRCTVHVLYSRKTHCEKQRKYSKLPYRRMLTDLFLAGDGREKTPLSLQEFFRDGMIYSVLYFMYCTALQCSLYYDNHWNGLGGWGWVPFSNTQVQPIQAQHRLGASRISIYSSG